MQLLARLLELSDVDMPQTLADNINEKIIAQALQQTMDAVMGQQQDIEAIQQQIGMSQPPMGAGQPMPPEQAMPPGQMPMPAGAPTPPEAPVPMPEQAAPMPMEQPMPMPPEAPVASPEGEMPM
jgi:hypothetical protein